MPAEWRRLVQRPLREMQARALARMAAGDDLVVNAATGSGKGLLLALPALAAWAAATPGEPAPVELAIVPFAALISSERVFLSMRLTGTCCQDAG